MLAVAPGEPHELHRARHATIHNAAQDRLSAILSRAANRSTITCLLRGKRVAHDTAADCHGPPPGWGWWRDHRNCLVTNACLHEGSLTLYSGQAPAASLRIPSGGGPLACTSWKADEGSYTTKAASGLPPPAGRGADGVDVVWYDVGLHADRVLSSHFGHDVLQNYFYMFNTFWEFGLTGWLAPGAARAYHFVGDESTGSANDTFLRTVRYRRNNARVWSGTRHCFRAAMLSNAHTHAAELVFRRRSPSRLAREAWWGYRDLWLRAFCPECARALRRPSYYAADCPPPSDVNITILFRSHDPQSSAVIFANGRGRRIANQHALARALSSVGVVTQQEPSKLSLHEQHALMLRTRVLIARMSSAVVGALWMRPGSICVEVEAPDPSSLYYDHPSTFEEIAELFGHTFYRSSDTNSSRRGLPLMPIVGDTKECEAKCVPPKQLRAFVGRTPERLALQEQSEARCIRRCAEVQPRWPALKARPDTYVRDQWYMNWWIADTYADVPHVVDLVSQGLGCATSRQAERTADSVRRHHEVASAAAVQIVSAAAAHGPVHAPLVYMPGSLEVAWSANVGVWQGGAGDEPEWAAGCAALRSQAANISRWLDWASHRRRAAGAVDSAPTGLARAPPELSRWRSASGSRPRPAARVPIEPLVGHLRHPRFHCVGPERDTLELMFSTDYLVLPSEAELQLPAGARRLFFDLGASRYNQSCALGCQKWFVEAYAAQGISFDRILGWEAAEVNHAQMWRDVPGHLKPRMQYFNTPVSDEPASSDNPLNHLRALARPEDFVVFKLDIDTPTVEVSLIRQILGSPATAGLIDELFWEHHVRRSPLVKTRVSLFGKSGIGWGEHLPSPTASDSTLADSHRLFRQLRERGIRAHSWI